MKLKATKTSLYKLVSKYFVLPAIKHTDYVKVKSSYILSWYGDCEVGFRAFFSAVGEQVCLSVDLGSERVKFIRFTVEELQELGMIDIDKAVESIVPEVNAEVSTTSISCDEDKLKSFADIKNLQGVCERDGELCVKTHYFIL